MTKEFKSVFLRHKSEHPTCRNIEQPTRNSKRFAFFKWDADRLKAIMALNRVDHVECDSVS